MQKLLFIYILAFLVACTSKPKDVMKDWQIYTELQNTLDLKETFDWDEKWLGAHIEHASGYYKNTGKTVKKIKIMQNAINAAFADAKRTLIGAQEPNKERLSSQVIVEGWVQKGAAQTLCTNILNNLDKALTEWINYMREDGKNPFGLKDEEIETRIEQVKNSHQDLLVEGEDVYGIMEEVQRFDIVHFENKSVAEALIQLVTWEQKISIFYDNLVENLAYCVGGRNFFHGHPRYQLGVHNVDVFYKRYRAGEEVEVLFYIHESYWESQYDSIRYRIDEQEIYRDKLFWIGERRTDSIGFKPTITTTGTHEATLTIETYTKITGWEQKGTQLITYKIQ